MKKVLKTVLVSGMSLSLVACSGGGSATVEQVEDAKEVYGCDVLNVFNAGEYIGENVLSNFETMYNAKVNYDTFESNEMMYTKLLGGGKYVLIGNLIEDCFVSTGNWNFGAAISMIMAIIILISMYITKKLDKQTEEVQD